MLNVKTLRAEWVTLLASLYLLIGFNTALWEHLETAVPPGMVGMWLLLAFAVMMLFAFNLLLTLVAFRYVLKPLLIVLFMSGAGVAYFMNQYGVLIDTGMFRNMAETNVAEVRDLLSIKFALYIGLLGVLPSVLLWKARIAYRPWHRELLGKLVVSGACVAALGSVALVNYQGLSSLFRNHHEIRLMLTPSNIVGASFGYVSERLGSAARPFQHYGEDAKRDPHAWQRHERKSLTVLVVGESARAENFGVLGYGRDTTPRLNQEQGLLAFSDVHSCGTETAVSVPCMFSGMPRKDYDARVAKNREGLLDILQRAGLSVQWRDNQSGCKGTCDRVQFVDVSNLKDPKLCADGECHDEILLQGLGELLDNLTQDIVLVLHQMGSHGPDYYKRYPASAERFTPVCQSNALNQCDQQAIVNSYDNTLAYTDQVLGSLIDLLRSRQDKVDTAMIYLSDHGESLGEYNLYLHGTPYMLAPEQQRHVPLLVWFSDSYRQDFALDTDCLGRLRDAPLSQDNLFHSMLGLLQVRTEVYRQSMDMFASCRPWMTADR
ncbi:phosphoethanolamine--lipid A transferase [Pseudomonas guariconensis]|uniref:phosphoethanolamine transferase n=1 Tax=Pseudomonas guariconensis TaxID=1288410 RepID=UPI0025A93A31|nr:phosphoethanolamine--lipid A transferase [Pseudomonas guariconensis]MDM9592980.1 phosphoethanolamine--lipid A transferase [Pseudomonas guariconensis]MDM9605807.1 phosphoethanolamine--lipid A transferase [Pseudomonas guariconensis]MDM9610764.1 phosphoethanolamine--lipid A transferase [Pseudomonas guariconensis]